VSRPFWWILPAAFLLGCGATAPREPSPAGEGTALRLVLRADRSVYALGAPVTLTLAVTNPGPAPVTLTAPSSQLYDFAVLRDGAEVWRWSAGRMFLAVLTDLTIRPGETRAFTEVWDQRDRDGRPVGPGDYVVVGRLIGGERLGLAPERLRIAIR